MLTGADQAATGVGAPVAAAVARFATQDDHLLLDGYARFCHRLGLADRGLRDRLRLARLFLAEHPDLAAWMTRPTRTRLADVRRIKAWPLLSWAALSGAVRVDLDLLAAKDLGGMSAAVRNGCVFVESPGRPLPEREVLAAGRVPSFVPFGRPLNGDAGG